MSLHGGPTGHDARILITGATGQIGHELVRELATLGRVEAPGRAEFDLASPDSVRAALRRLAPAIVVNAAAYTMVDRAESEPDLCAQVNTEAPALLAAECRDLGAVLVHLSTDYVFDGTKRSPYVETDETAPLGVYGRTKRGGELAIIAAGGAHLIVRTAWVYAARGHNFPATMRRLARERDELAIVDDQVGAPTSAPGIASGIAQMLRVLSREPDVYRAAEDAAGIYHMTAAGSTTWFEFARRVLADDPRAIEHTCRVVRPISTDEYARQGGAAAPRPAYSVLDNSRLADRFGVTLAPWTEQWRVVAEQMRLRAQAPASRSTG